MNICATKVGVLVTVIAADADGSNDLTARRFGDRRAAADFMARMLSELIADSNFRGERDAR